MVTMYLHVHNEARRSSSLKVVVSTNTQTDTQADITENITYLHTWMETFKKVSGSNEMSLGVLSFLPNVSVLCEIPFPLAPSRSELPMMIRSDR